MGFAAFVYVTFEMFAVGLISPMAEDLGVTEGQIGLLMTVYAGLVAVVTIPLMEITRKLDRKPVFMATLICLLAGIALQATAANYWMLVAGRVCAAFTHGLFWSLVNPMAARLAPKGMTGRAIGVVSLGSTMALVMGSPLTTLVGGAIGWRNATWLLGVLVAGSFAALLFFLPSMPAIPPAGKSGEANQKSALPALVLYLTLVITALFCSYTYLGLFVERTIGETFVALGLAGYGLFGIVGVLSAGRRSDRRMIRMNFIFSGLIVVAGILGALALGLISASPALALIPALLVVVFLGTAGGGLPTAATTIFLFAGEDNQNRASSIYVVTFQVGIASGSAVGAIPVDAGFFPGTLLITAVLGALAMAELSLRARPILR
ncbi:MFS transporter [Corynebacterium sp. CCUG 69979]|uniref:MFS transporter n=1 Tax=unclassified Corynebacterium TaxID=2624378 RepID=UPI00210DB77A|nr:MULTISPECIES: MFS transporter [unclassified Corynebacterium]MCQ4623060.1 MFS transporter [Corynebacterium sp. CCUG 70398]MCQ4624317.1 MFS transporter [Corynebacterium sp. CCUG 69979]